MPPADTQTNASPRAMAIFLGWLLPGMGHISIGQKRRGFLVMFGALFLIVCGILVGGIDAVDHKGDLLWFIPQAMCGPIVITIDIVNQMFIAPLPISEKSMVIDGSYRILIS